MEKNLPLVSFPLADKGYNKWVIPFVGKLDDGNVFKNIIVIILTIFSFFVLIGGIYISIESLFGDSGYINRAITSDFLDTGKKIGSVIGLIVGLPLSILASWSLYSVIKKRTMQLKEEEFGGLLNYIFNKTIPKLIIICGEVLFILVLYGGIMQIVAALVGSYAYAPLTGFSHSILMLFPGMGVLGTFAPSAIYADYNAFAEFIRMGVMAIAGSFIVLIAFYIYKEVYIYILKLITILIQFLPRFAIPLAIRTRNEDKK